MKGYPFGPGGRGRDREEGYLTHRTRIAKRNGTIKQMASGDSSMDVRRVVHQGGVASVEHFKSQIR